MENDKEEFFPERINVTKVLTYLVEDIRQQIATDRETKIWNGSDWIKDENESIEVTLQDVIDMIYDYAEDDFGCEWGHKGSIKNVFIQDENGNDY